IKSHIYSLIGVFSLTPCAITFQKLHKAGESPTSDHLSPPTPGLVYSTPSDHAALHSRHSPPDRSKLTETHQPKHHCNTTHHLKFIHKPTDNPKSSTTHHVAPPTSEQNHSNQRKDPIIRNGRSVDSADSTETHKKLSDTKFPTQKPKSKTTCSKTTKSKTVTRNQNTSVTPSEITTITLDSKRTTSRKTTTVPHNSVNSEINKKPTHYSEKSTTVTKTSYKSVRTTERREKTNDHTTDANYKTTVASDKTLTKTNKREQPKETPRAPEKYTHTQANPTYRGKQSTTAHEEITTPPEMPTESRQNIHTKKSTPTKNTTPFPAKPSENSEKTTLATETIKGSIKPTENPAKNTAATETVRSPVKFTGDKSITTSCCHQEMSESTRLVSIGSFTVSTSSMELSSILSEAPGNKSHPHQNKHGSQGGLHVGETGESDSFPPWAIVIVVLVAVILLLVFLGLIFLVSYMTRTRRALTHTAEDNDPEDDGGPNSYPVYLMEQQTLGVGQIPSSR
uniref:Mucin like 3 n=1 Tax=Rhinolophus ferrumequinum TaxID=59479 RepID=A0A671DJU3_RHIFE